MKDAKIKIIFIPNIFIKNSIYLVDFVGIPLVGF